MIRKIGTMLFVLASCALLTIGCQEQTDNVVKKDPVSKSDTKPTTNPDDEKYREVSITVTGLG